MLPQHELDYIVGVALMEWSTEHQYRKALPPSWLGNLHEMVRGYHDRLVDAGRFEREIFQKDVLTLVQCLAAQFVAVTK